MEQTQSVVSFCSSRNERMSLNNSAISMSRNVYIPKPMLCKVCKRGSFLKCFDCDVIYCSAKCQIKDWENHQYSHAQNRENNQPRILTAVTGLGRENLQNRLYAARSEPVKPQYGDRVKAVTGKSPPSKEEVAQTSSASQAIRAPRTSVIQERLNVARSEPVKQETEKNTKPVDEAGMMEVDSLCSDLSTVTLKNTLHPLASEESIIDQSVRKMISVRKFKRHVPLDPELMEDGFYFIAVLTEELHPDGTLVYWVTPFEQRTKLDDYKAQLQASYSTDDVPVIPMQEVTKFKPHLVMAKIAGSWSRAQILSVDEKGVVGVECIDTGEKAVLVYTQNQLKVAREPELMKSAFGIKMQFENIDKAGFIEPGDIVKVRITQAVPYGINIAEVCMQPAEDAMEGGEADSGLASVKSETAIRFTIDQLEVKELHEGDVKLLYCDGSKLEAGKLHVSESIKENWTLYDKLADEIAAFIKENPAAGGYKPVVRELVLARFNDDMFYRAVCKNASDVDVKVHFIDYGSDYVVEFKDVYQMPETLMYVCVSHTVDVQLASGGSLKAVNGEDTRQLLLDKNEFVAKVKKLSDSPRKYMIVIDDSLVVF